MEYSKENKGEANILAGDEHEGICEVLESEEYNESEQFICSLCTRSEDDGAESMECDHCELCTICCPHKTDDGY